MIQLASWKLPTLSDSNITCELLPPLLYLDVHVHELHIVFNKHGCFNVLSHLLPFLYVNSIKNLLILPIALQGNPPSSVCHVRHVNPSQRFDGSWRSAVAEAIFSGIFASVFAQKNQEIRDFPFWKKTTLKKKKNRYVFQTGFRLIKKIHLKFGPIFS